MCVDLDCEGAQVKIGRAGSLCTEDALSDSEVSASATKWFWNRPGRGATRPCGNRDKAVVCGE
jgi:hypothetical protein